MATDHASTYGAPQASTKEPFKFTNDKLSHRFLATLMSHALLGGPAIVLGVITWNIYVAAGAILAPFVWFLFFNVEWTWNPAWKALKAPKEKTNLTDLFLSRIDSEETNEVSYQRGHIGGKTE